MNIIFYQRNRFGKGITREKAIDLAAKRDNIQNLFNMELDHIIPYCISENNDLSNLQLLSHKKHLEKTILDKKILKKLRENGYYENLFGYSLRLLKPKEEVINKFKEYMIEMIEMIR